MVDHHQYRLDFAQQAFGVEPINFDKVDDPANVIIDSMNGRGVDSSIDAVGFEAKGTVTAARRSSHIPIGAGSTRPRSRSVAEARTRCQ